MCKICDQKPIWTGDYFDEYFNKINLASGNWTELFAGVEENGKIYLSGYGDGETDHYYPKFCPECGKPLSEIPQEVKDENKSKPAEWISVKDRLPRDDETGVTFICMTNATGRSKGVVPMKFQKTRVRGIEIRRWIWHDVISPWEVTHWMPLPEPPTKRSRQ